MLTANEVASLLGLSPRTVYDFAGIKPLRPGRRVKV